MASADREYQRLDCRTRQLPGRSSAGTRTAGEQGNAHSHAAVLEPKAPPQIAYVLTTNDGTKLAVHVLEFNNTISWQFRYEPVAGAYLPLTAQRVMDSLTDQMRAVQDLIHSLAHRGLIHPSGVMLTRAAHATLRSRGPHRDLLRHLVKFSKIKEGRLMTEPLAPEDFPGPPGLPFLGNVRAIDLGQPIESLMSLAREYGPIFKLTTPGGISVVVSGVDLVSEICDDARFDKVITAGLSILAEGPVDAGLFTAHTDDPMWARAHGLLMAPFSMQAMRDYMPAMIDIADQLMNKWDRLNPDEEIDVPADMTRLTLDTIALCGFGYRFNSFYRETPHPFVQAMVRVLDEAQTRTRQLPIQTRLKISAQRQFEEDQAFMASLVDDLIRKRRALGDAADNTDLLGRMITGVDKQTGLTLPDENIRAQCITFLVAGHETTSGLLSFAIYFLLEHPEYLDRAREEVDRVLGGTLQPTFDQMHELTYVRQVLDEALRLWPTAAGFRRHAREDTVIGGGRYAIPEDLGMMVLSPMLHRDKSIWGEDAEEFNPDHTTPERMSTIPPNAYKPFGTGQRACIGRQFALQEAVLVLGMLLQRFDLIKDPTYRLHTKVTLTVKPADLYVQVRRRADRPIDKAAPVAASSTTQSKPGLAVSNAHHTPLAVLFGSNLGTAEGLATRLAQEGTERGYDVTLGSLDDYVEQLPAKAAILVCSSYNGLPPDNAVKFHHWVDEAGAEAFKDLSYTVFGCGNTEWATTYQAVPTELDAGLEQHGATRIHPRGAGDVRGDFDAAYRNWHDTLWKDIANALGVDAPHETDESQARLVDNGDESAGDQSGHHVLPRPGGRRTRQP